MNRSTLKFACPNCGRTTDQTMATAVDKKTRVWCFNYTAHKNGTSRVMKVQHG